MILKRVNTVTAAVIGLFLIQTAQAETCGTATVMAQGACKDLKVEFDLSKCNAGKGVAAKVVDCKDTSATAKAEVAGRVFTAKLTGAAGGGGWGGDSVQWTAAVVKSPKPKPAKTETAAVAAPVAAAPVAAATPSPSATPQAAAKPAPPAAPSPTPVAAPAPAAKPAAPVAVLTPAASANAPLQPAEPTPAPVATLTTTTPPVSAAPSPSPAPAPAAVAGPPSAPVALTWNGDLRLRFESIRQDRQNPGSYTQSRIRARFGLNADLGDDTTLYFRLASGPGRVSTNQTLGASNNMSANYGILLDRAGFRWSFIPGIASVSGGRISNPLWAPGSTDVMWDADLNFDGAAANAEYKIGSWNPFAAIGFFYLNQVTSGDAASTQLLSSQLGTKVKINDDWKAGVAAGFHHYIAIVGRTNPFGASAAASALSGNTVTGASSNVWVNNYDIFEAGPEVQTKLFGKSLTVFADYLRNTAITDESVGYVAGFKFGDLKTPGDYQIAYDYRRLEKDSVLDTMADGDSGGGGTDLYSHRISLSYKAKKNWQVGLSVFLGEKAISDSTRTATRNKIHYDFIFAF